MFCAPDRTVQRYRFDGEAGGCTFDAAGGERLLRALGGAETLPEALARRMPMDGAGFARMLEGLGIPCRAL